MVKLKQGGVGERIDKLRRPPWLNLIYIPFDQIEIGTTLLHFCIKDKKWVLSFT
jgi:hypothetical protein